MPHLPLYDELREKELSSLLEMLCRDLYDDTKIEKFALQFIGLYTLTNGTFHAPYGVISGCITELYTKYGKDYLDQIPYNLNRIIAFMKHKTESDPSKVGRKRCIQAYRSVVDLQDHVSMVVIRVDQLNHQLGDAKRQADIVLEEAKQLNKATNAVTEYINQIGKKVSNTVKNARDISHTAENLKTEMVSILAIFAAIILAFTGSLTVLGGVVAAVNEAQLYRLLLVTIFCIWGLFNTIYLLLCVVSRICEKNLSADCGRSSCRECPDKETCKGIRRFLRQSPYVVGFNALLIIMCVAIITLNRFGFLN